MRSSTSTRRGARVLATLAVTALVVAATASVAGADLEWQPAPTDLSASDQLGFSPRVAAIGGDDAVAIWAETIECGCEFGVNAATWDGGTNTWSASTAIPGQSAQVLAIPPFGADLALAGSPNGTAIAAWSTIDIGVEEDDEDDSIVVQASTYSGGTWSAPEVLGVAFPGAVIGFGGIPNVDVSIDEGGRAVAVWTAFDPGTLPDDDSDDGTVIHAATSSSGTWSSAVTISGTGGEEVNYARVASTGSGRAVAIWTGCGCGPDLLRSNTFDGSAWLPEPQNVDPSGEDSPILPVITSPAPGTAVAAWVDFDGGTGNDVVRTATYASGAWSNHATVSDPDAEADTPDVAPLGSGTTAVVWVSLAIETTDVRAETFPDVFGCACPGVVQSSVSTGGGAWSIPIDLSDATASAPDVTATEPGLGLAVWQTEGDEDSRIQGASFGAATATAARFLSPDGAFGFLPQTAGTGAGTAQTVWSGSDGILGLLANASLGAPEVVKVATPGGTATLATAAGGFLHVKNEPLPASPAPPPGVSFPYGMFSFDIVNLTDGASATVTLTLPAPVTEFWKLQHEAWTLVTGATFAGNQVTYTLVDGGFGDADGVPNGTIVDPGAPGIAALAPLTFTG